MARKDDMIDLPDNAATICKFEGVFAKIASLGTEILHPSLEIAPQRQVPFMACSIKFCLIFTQSDGLKQSPA